MVSGQQQPGQYPMYQPVYQPPQRSAHDMMRSMVSDAFLAIAVVIGLLLMMVGFWLLGLMDTNAGRNVGQILASLGVYILAAGGLLGAILRQDMDKYIRAALVLFATALIALVGFWYTFLNF